MTSPATPTTGTTTEGVTGATKAPQPVKATETKEVVAAKVDATKDVKGAASKVVRYKGGRPGKRRIITAADFESIGIKDQDGVEFNVINAWKLPASDFTAEALRYCEHVDPNLEVVEED